MLLVVCFLSTFCLIISAGLLLFHRDRIFARLESVLEGRAEAKPSRLMRVLKERPAAVKSIVKPFEKVIPRSEEEASVIQKRLIRAGYRQSSAVNVFYGAKVLV